MIFLDKLLILKCSRNPCLCIASIAVLGLQSVKTEDEISELILSFFFSKFRPSFERRIQDTIKLHTEV